MGLSIGKRTRLHRLMYEHGPANGTLMMLPIDQGLEHGPVDFFDNPDAPVEVLGVGQSFLSAVSAFIADGAAVILRHHLVARAAAAAVRAREGL
jgi:DhnA family fructose-bisphosphate aldolase class Ia